MDFYSEPPSYRRFRQRVFQCRGRFPQVRVFPAGKSVRGRNLYVLGLGNLQSVNLMAGGWHGQEWLTTLVLMKFFEELAAAQQQGASMYGLPVEKNLRRTGLLVVPMVNPDGIELGFSRNQGADKWQANGRGVDLNHNFDANFPLCRRLEQKAGVFGPGPGKYGGPYPHSEPETRAMIQLCCSFHVRCAWAFHSQGEEIYWHYGEHTPAASLPMAQLISSVSGYRICEPAPSAAHGGFKDWFIQKLHRPGFTLEIGKGENPLPITDLEPVYQKLREAMVLMTVL